SHASPANAWHRLYSINLSSDQRVMYSSNSWITFKPYSLIERQAIFENINKHTNAAGIRLYAHLGAEVCGNLVTDILKNRAVASHKVRAKISGIQPPRGHPAEDAQMHTQKATSKYRDVVFAPE